MANTQPVFGRVPNNLGVDFDNADGTTKKAVVVAVADGTKALAISAVSDDITSNVMEIFWEDGTTAWPIGAITVPAGAGTDGSTAAVNLLDGVELPALDALGQVFLENPEEIQVAAAAAITATYTVTVVGYAVDYTEPA